MTDSSSRRLPPLSPKSETGDESEISRRPKRKKKVTSNQDTDGETPRARSSSRSRRESGKQVEADATPSTRKKKRKIQRDGSSPDGDFSLESPAGVRQQKKKKKVGSSRETLMEGIDDPVTSTGEDPPTAGRKKKGKKKKKKGHKSTIGSSGGEETDYIGLAAELSGLNEDVIDTKKITDEEDLVAHAFHLAPPTIRSEPFNKVFIEKKTGFKQTNKEQLMKKQLDAQLRAFDSPEPVVTRTTIEFALMTHKVFKTICLFCQGLFAGFALWHIVTVFMLSSLSGGYETFLNVYSPVALPVQCLYYFLFAICTVGVCDRYDIGRPNWRFVVRALTMQNGAISVLIYFLGLIFSLTIASTDDKIGLFEHNPTLWDDSKKRDSELNVWRILNVVRGMGAILGWLLVSLKPTTDRLSKNLERADDNIYGDFQVETEHMEVIQSNGVV